MVDFQIHKLTIETLGEYLSSIRTELGLTVEVVVGKTGMSPKFLTALESGNFQALPEPVYVVGFIKSLATLYKIPAGQLIEQFHRETAVAQREAVPGVRIWKTLASRLTPIRWTLFASCLGAAVFVGICVWQVLAIGRVPSLSVITPRADERVQGSLITVSGTATPGSEVAVNGQTVFAGSDGNFSSSVSFLAGTQTLIVSAKSRFGKEASQVITFVVEGAHAQIPAGPSMPLSSKTSTVSILP